jgi:regulator of protease activity HflC (stomatin/prohibitin superfamily)
MHIETVHIKPDILKLWNLCVTCKDGTAIRMRANVRYEIFDAVSAWNEVQDYKDNLADECRTNLAKVIRELDFPSLLADQGKVEREAKNAMNSVVKEWGIKVIRVGLTDFIKTKDISLAQV